MKLRKEPWPRRPPTWRAEVERLIVETDAAIQRLTPLAVRCDDENPQDVLNSYTSLVSASSVVGGGMTDLWLSVNRSLLHDRSQPKAEKAPPEEYARGFLQAAVECKRRLEQALNDHAAGLP